MPLVLKRRVNETIIIDNRIRITVVEVRGNSTRLLIDAPRSIDVVRAENWNEPGSGKENA